MGIAGVLILLGAFYNRISKVTIAGNSIELAAPASEGDKQDSGAIAAAVSEKVIDAWRKQGRLSGDTMSTDEAKEMAEKSAAAAAQTQRDVARLRRTAQVVVPATVPVVQVEPAQLSALSSGLPFPEDLLSRLADRAVKDKLAGSAEEETPPPAG